MMDHSTRYISDEGSVRAAAIVMPRTIQKLVDVQDPGANAGLLGELAIGTTLIRQLMAPDLRVQATLQAQASGNLFVDSFADGSTRGLANVPGGAELELGQSTILQVARILENGELQTGTVATAQSKGLSASFTTYMMSSEQVTSSFQLACVIEDGEVVGAGGWLLQVLPDHDDLFVTALLSRLEEAPPVEKLVRHTDAATMFDELVDLVPFNALMTEELRFGCNCSEDRMLRALRTVSDEDLAELRASEEQLEVGCDYCGTQYQLDPDDL